MNEMNDTYYMGNASMDMGILESDFLSQCINDNNDEQGINEQFCRNFFTKFLLLQSLEIKIPLFIFYCIIFLVGLFGNICVVLSIVTFSFMRSRTNLFLLNLAVSDLMVFFTCFPLNALYQIYPDWLFGPLLCKLVPFFQGISISVSIASLASISIKRFIIIRYPIHAKERITNTTMGVWILGIWIVSVAVCLPLFFAYEIEESTFFAAFKHTLCRENWKGSITKKRVYTIFLLTFLYLIPLVSMSIFYCMLGRTLVSTLKFTKETSRIGNNNQNSKNLRTVSQERKRISKMMIALLVAFAVCWAPYHFTNAWADFVESSKHNFGNSTGDSSSSVLISHILPVATLLGYINSAINPLCLIIISSRFRACFFIILKCKCFARDRHSSSDRREPTWANLHSMGERSRMENNNVGSLRRDYHEMQYLPPPRQSEPQVISNNAGYLPLSNNIVANRLLSTYDASPKFSIGLQCNSDAAASRMCRLVEDDGDLTETQPLTAECQCGSQDSINQ